MVPSVSGHDTGDRERGAAACSTRCAPTSIAPEIRQSQPVRQPEVVGFRAGRRPELRGYRRWLTEALIRLGARIRLRRRRPGWLGPSGWRMCAQGSRRLAGPAWPDDGLPSDLFGQAFGGAGAAVTTGEVIRQVDTSTELPDAHCPLS